MSEHRFQLTIGRVPDEDTWWLCLVDMDGTNVLKLAEFTSEAEAKVFTSFMETEGYRSLPLPSNRDLDELLDE